MTKTILLATVAAGAAVFVLEAGAFAQGFERDRNISVRERDRPEYDFRGRQIGSFVGHAEVNSGVEFNDNIFADNTEKESDVIVGVAPSIRLESDFARHVLNLSASVDHREYIDLSDESVTNAQVNAFSRIDISRRTQLFGEARYDSLNEPRTSSSSPAAIVEPVEFEVVTLSAGVAHTLNRLRLSAQVDRQEFDYTDAELIAGGVVEQDDRDRETIIITARADYAISPDRSIFVETRLDDREYDLETPDALVDRDSYGWGMLVGVDFDISSVARGEVAFGYVNQDIDDPTLEDLNGLSGRASVEWFATQLTTVELAADRSVEDSGIVGVAAVLGNTVSARVDHELRRNVILTGEIAYDQEEYDSIDREDTRTRFYAGATYLLNRRIALDAYYSRPDQKSEGAAAGPDYTVNRVGLNLRVRL